MGNKSSCLIIANNKNDDEVDYLSKETESLTTTMISQSSSLPSSPTSSNASYFSNNSSDNDYQYGEMKEAYLVLEEDDENNNSIGCIKVPWKRNISSYSPIVVDRSVDATLSILKKQQQRRSSLKQSRTKKHVTILEKQETTRQKIFSYDNQKIFIFTCEISTLLPCNSSNKAVNSILRAAYLHNITKRDIVVVLPWLEQEDQLKFHGEVIYPNKLKKKTCIKNYLSQLDFLLNESFPIQFEFYPVKYHQDSNYIFGTNDILQSVSSCPDSTKDVCILEEPEHLNCK